MLGTAQFIGQISGLNDGRPPLAARTCVGDFEGWVESGKVAANPWPRFGLTTYREPRFAAGFRRLLCLMAP